MMLNEKISEMVAVVGQIPPSSQSAGSAVTGWVPMTNIDRILAHIQVGTFGASATVDANIEQAQDSSGTGAKVIGTGKAITQLLSSGGNNVQALIDVRAGELDAANGFEYVQLTVTVGTAATETAASLIGACARYEPASAFNAASVVQVV